MEPINENKECVAHEPVNGESYVADLEVKNLTLECNLSHKKMLILSMLDMLNVSDLVYALKVVVVRKFLNNLLM